MQNSEVSTGRRDALLRGDFGPRVHAPSRIRRLAERTLKLIAPEDTAPASRIALAMVSHPPRPARAANYYEIKKLVFDALVDTIDVAQISTLQPRAQLEEIRAILRQIVTGERFVMTSREEEYLLQDIWDDLLGRDPLEPLLARDDIADIRVICYFLLTALESPSLKNDPASA